MSSIPELQEIVRQASKIHIFGAGTKSALHSAALRDPVTTISTQWLSGIVSYDPQEFVITLWSGTPLIDVIALLAEQGQYLPFDPLLASRGATIGGSVASNASGPGRFRFGGVRDFLLGVRFIDGQGNCVRGGGQVVKNAAGFDYPKLMVGSQGKLGLIYELTFKVFPRPEATATIIGFFPQLKDAIATMNRLAMSAADIESLDLIPMATYTADVRGEGYEIAVRIAGIHSAIPKRIKILQSFLPEHRVLSDEYDVKFWFNACNMNWISPEDSLTKLPISTSAIPTIESALEGLRVRRRYSVGGNVAWIAMPWTGEWNRQLGDAITVLGSDTVEPHMEMRGASHPSGAFARAIQRSLDPHSKFV